MTGPLVQQRCSNHPSRESVCRCPACGRTFCRECVTEHAARLLCADCLKAAVGPAVVTRGRAWRWFGPALALAGMLLAWLVFYAGGEIQMERTAHGAREIWQQP